MLHPAEKVEFTSPSIDQIAYIRGIPCETDAEDMEVGHHGPSRPKDNWRKRIPYVTKHRVKTDEEGGHSTESSRAKIKNQRSVDGRMGTNGKMDGQDKTKYRSGPRRPRKHQVAATNC